MICYRDKSFCSENTCGNTECNRHLGQRDIDNAKKVGLLIALMDFRTDRCGFETVKEPQK